MRVFTTIVMDGAVFAAVLFLISVGLTKFNPQYGFPTMDRVMSFKAEEIMPPVGVKSPDWIGKLTK